VDGRMAYRPGQSRDPVLLGALTWVGVDHWIRQIKSILIKWIWTRVGQSWGRYEVQVEVPAEAWSEGVARRFRRLWFVSEDQRDLCCVLGTLPFGLICTWMKYFVLCRLGECCTVRSRTYEVHFAMLIQCGVSSLTGAAASISVRIVQ
jgi:hypothetical protein